ncbi:MAG: di-trans,poly-cis-decaprenylcistransferase [Bryobacteraceae bacterium]
MKQSSFHVAIIMDGNGRWATRRGLPRVAGHHAGAGAVRRTVEAAPKLGVRALTLYSFSSDNWQRPRPEVTALMELFRSHLRSEASRCAAEGIRIQVIGRRDRLDRALVGAIEEAEGLTAAGTMLDLRIAVDYSARDTILSAAVKCGGKDLDRTQFENALSGAPDVDLLIRTGGEQRLSDFLLWECAYAELCFLQTMWPDFGEAELQEAISEFYTRERRFGRLPEAAAG